jgi:3-deoxy-manno-octulosonate cytidylyltransferase (CMP-KDO synthetase)
MSRVLGVIPARYAATRFPGKPLEKILGKELITWVIEGALQSTLLSEVLVATDDERIASVASKAGVRAVMTESALPSGSDRIWAAVKNENCDVVINIQGDEPLITGMLIDRLIEPALQDASLEMVTLAHPLSAEAELQSMNAVKVVVNQNSDALYFSRFPIPYSRLSPKEAGLMAALKHIGLYAYRKSFLGQFCTTPPVDIEKAESLEQLRALHLGARIRVVPVRENLVGVDTPEDLRRVEEILKMSRGHGTKEQGRS